MNVNMNFLTSIKCRLISRLGETLGLYSKELVVWLN